MYVGKLRYVDAAADRTYLQDVSNIQRHISFRINEISCCSQAVECLAS